MDDPDAPMGTWDHWVAYDIEPLAEVPEGIRSLGTAGTNSWGHTGYGGPCPPIGRHRYFHKLYALDTILPDMGKPTKAQLEESMQGHILDQAQLMGTYEKSSVD